jgi:hypothetical protein
MPGSRVTEGVGLLLDPRVIDEPPLHDHHSAFSRRMGNCPGASLSEMEGRGVLVLSDGLAHSRSMLKMPPARVERLMEKHLQAPPPPVERQ